MTHRLASFFLILTALGCNGPFGLLPGGSLTGAPAEAPRDWSFAGEAGTIQLETRHESRSGEPYSVNLAYTVIDGRLYINAGGTETQWAKNIARDPFVRLQLDGHLYDLQADRVIDSDEIVTFSEAWTGQSFFRRDPRKYAEVWIYELRPPSESR
jgi:hypothetical protein